jgi:heme A synthase
MPALEEKAEGASRLVGSLGLQLIIVIVLVYAAKYRRHKVEWDRVRATRVQWLCGIYLGVLYLAAFLGNSPGLGALGYPFAVYFLALSLYRKRDLGKS